MSAPRSYSPVPIPSGLRPSPLDKGSRPRTPVYGRARFDGLVKCYRRGVPSGHISLLPPAAAPWYRTVTIPLYWLWRACLLLLLWCVEDRMGPGRTLPRGYIQ